VPTYLLDTGVLLRHLCGQKAAVRLMRELGDKNRPSISAITRAEVSAGIRSDEDQVTCRLLSRLDTLSADQRTADLAGDLVRRARGRGRTLHLGDALIAATAIQYNLTLVTLNRADFEHLGLSLCPLCKDPA
jgi:predicted nucleic acid-binding protein